MKRERWYVGRVKGATGWGYEAFQASETPVPVTHGDQYVFVIGPFDTKRGAKWAERYSFHNPHCQCVADAERLAMLPEFQN